MAAKAVCFKYFFTNNYYISVFSIKIPLFFIIDTRINQE